MLHHTRDLVELCLLDVMVQDEVVAVTQPWKHDTHAAATAFERAWISVRAPLNSQFLGAGPAFARECPLIREACVAFASLGAPSLVHLALREKPVLLASNRCTYCTR